MMKYEEIEKLDPTLRAVKEKLIRLAKLYMRAGKYRDTDFYYDHIKPQVNMYVGWESGRNDDDPLKTNEAWHCVLEHFCDMLPESPFECQYSVKFFEAMQMEYLEEIVNAFIQKYAIKFESPTFQQTSSGYCCVLKYLPYGIVEV